MYVVSHTADDALRSFPLFLSGKKWLTLHLNITLGPAIAKTLAKARLGTPEISAGVLVFRNCTHGMLIASELYLFL
jgi:hypothetical protein